MILPAVEGATVAGASLLRHGILRRRWTRAVDTALGHVAESVGAAIVLASVCILSANVFARYVLHDPLIWGDELVTSLFMWLMMMGSVGAFRRNEHLRLTSLSGRVPPHIASIMHTVSTVIVATFCVLLIGAMLSPGYQSDGSSLPDFFATTYLGQEMIDLTPALGISRTYILMAIAVGLAMILTMAILRLIDERPRIVIPVVSATVLVVLAGFLASDAISRLGNLNLLIFFVLFIGVELAIGVPISFAFGMATLGYLGLATHVPVSVVAGMMNQATSNMVLLAAPMFVLLGLAMEATGMARRMVDAIAAFVGHLRGGLYVVEVVAMFLVSGISGSKLADMAAVAPVLFPEMSRRGYSRSEMSALLATSGAAMELIPPSLLLIIIASVCNLSIASLFTAGLLPAFLASVLLVAVALVRSRHEKLERSERVPWARRARFLIAALPALVLPVLIRYIVAGGIATATEVSTISVIYTLLVGTFFYREFDVRRIYPILRETANLIGSILLIVAMATGMSWALTQSGFATTLASVLEHAPGGRLTFWALSLTLFIVLGSVLEGIPVIVLFGTLLFPIAGQIGIHEIHYAVVVVLAMSIGLFAPPLGVGFYQSCAFGKINPESVMASTVPYLVSLVVSLAAIVLIPWISIGFL